MDEKKTAFTAAERAAWTPPNCERCGKSDRVTAQWHVTQAMGSEPVHVLGLLDCPCQSEQIQSPFID